MSYNEKSSSALSASGNGQSLDHLTVTSAHSRISLHESKDGLVSAAEEKVESVHQQESSDNVDHIKLKDEAPPDGDALVGFRVFPDGIVIQPEPFNISLKITALREQMASQLQVPNYHVVIRFGGVLASHTATLYDCGVLPGDNVMGEISIDPSQTTWEYKMPSEFPVNVFDDKGDVMAGFVMNVEYDEQAKDKPYLGGFRNKRTGAVYHHASTQTSATSLKKKWAGKPLSFSRETQTVTVVARSTQTKREASTQMTRPGVYVDARQDMSITTKSYMTADELDAIRQAKALQIQCAWRSHTARDQATKLAEAKASFKIRQEEDQNAKEALERERLEAVEGRRLQPRTAADFELLRGEVETWRLMQTQSLESETDLDATTKTQKYAELLQKETAMLQTILRLKNEASSAMKQQKVEKLLAEMSAPKQWEMSDGEVASVHTPFTQRAAELRDLYKSLSEAPGASSSEQRMDVLLNVKWTVKEFDCPLTREIVDLIDREADLLNRGRKQSRMANLRTRISNLFLNWLKTPEFNPEASRFQKIPQPLSSRPDVKPIIQPKDKRRGVPETWAAVQAQRSKVSLGMNGGLAAMSSERASQQMSQIDSLQESSSLSLGRMSNNRVE